MIKPRDTSDAIWIKCNGCGEIIYSGELIRNLRICSKCNYYFPLEPAERIALLADNKNLKRYTSDIACPDKLNCDRAIVTGEIKLSGCRLVTAAIDLELEKGISKSVSVGQFICSKVAEAICRAVDQRIPLLLCINGFGHQFLTQSVSISAAISRLNREKLLFISILAQPDPAHNFPGFAYLADIVIVESNVIAKTEKNLPNLGALTLFNNGLADMIVPRREMKQTLADILRFFR